jgi:hypothetical protein
MFAATLQVLSGDADLYMYADNFNDPPNPPAYWPFSDRSLCGCTTGSTSLGGCRYSSQYQPTLWTTSCNIGTKTELFNMNWGTGIPYNLHLVVAGWATSSLYTLTTVYYYLLKSSYTVTVPASTATAGSKQLFQFTSSATASGFIVFATPTTSGVGDPDIYASFWNFTQFPTSSSFLISSTNEGAETMIVSDPSTFRTSASYAIMINNYVSGAYKIEVADIYTLRPGIPSPQMTLEKQNAAVYFTIRIPDCDRVSIVLTNTAGDADLYVNNKQFRSGGYNQPCNCAYKSERSGDDSIHMDWLDQTWSNDVYISVMSYSVPATFTVTVYPMFVMGEAEVYRVSTSFASFMTNARSAVSRRDWDTIRYKVYARTGNTCECCGVHGRMEAHERWQFLTEPIRIQKLVRLISLCHFCHESTHMGLASINGRKKQAMKHLSRVTGLRGSYLDSHVSEAWALWIERSKHTWELDVSMLSMNGFEIKHRATPESRAQIASHAETSTPKQSIKIVEKIASLSTGGPTKS